MPPRRQILQRPIVTAPCYSVAALTVCVVMVGSVAPRVPTIGVISQRMNPHHCTTWILDGPSRSNRKARDALRWMDGQAFKSTGIVNPKSSEIPTVCLKELPTNAPNPQMCCFLGSWKRRLLLRSHSHRGLGQSPMATLRTPHSLYRLSVWQQIKVHGAKNESRTKTWNGEREMF